MNQQEAISWVKEYVHGCDNPDFQNYFGDRSLDGRYTWYVGHLIALARLRNARVLDIGCGFGWDAVSLAVFANARVVANDVRSTMTNVVQQEVRRLKAKGCPISIETLTGDICTLALPPASFDAIVCQGAIEHIHDLPALFRISYRLLPPGGHAVFTNDNNLLNRKLAAEVRSMWQLRDADQSYVDELKKERPIENHDIEPYRVTRARIITEANPELSTADVDRIADATAGLVKSEIEALARSYRPGDVLPKPPAASWCRNPITAEYCERLLDPFELAGELRSAGFKVSVHHAFRKLPLRWLNRLNFRPINIELFNYRPFFMICAKKPADRPS